MGPIRASWQAGIGQDSNIPFRAVDWLLGSWRGRLENSDVSLRYDLPLVLFLIPWRICTRVSILFGNYADGNYGAIALHKRMRANGSIQVGIYQGKKNKSARDQMILKHGSQSLFMFAIDGYRGDPGGK